MSYKRPKKIKKIKICQSQTVGVKPWFTWHGIILMGYSFLRPLVPSLGVRRKIENRKLIFFLIFQQVFTLFLQFFDICSIYCRPLIFPNFFSEHKSFFYSAHYWKKNKNHYSTFFFAFVSCFAGLVTCFSKLIFITLLETKNLLNRFFTIFSKNTKFLLQYFSTNNECFMFFPPMIWKIWDSCFCTLKSKIIKCFWAHFKYKKYYKNTLSVWFRQF
jgi:hypothetical protein